MLSGITAGAGGAFPGLGQVGAGNARLANAMATASQEAWPGAERKGREPPGESRGGTPSGEPRPKRVRVVTLARVARSSENQMRLSAFRFPFVVASEAKTVCPFLS
jgi:hypothetical protein